MCLDQLPLMAIIPQCFLPEHALLSSVDSAKPSWLVLPTSFLVTSGAISIS